METLAASALSLHAAAGTLSPSSRKAIGTALEILPSILKSGAISPFDVGQVSEGFAEEPWMGVEEAPVVRSEVHYHLNPLLLTSELSIIAGHARYEVALRMGLNVVPAIILPKLSEADSIGLRIANNAISEKGRWSLDLLSRQIELLSSMKLDFNPIEIGFETPQVDQLLFDGRRRRIADKPVRQRTGERTRPRMPP